MSLYYKIVKGQTPAYLFDHVPKEAPCTLRKYVPKAPIARTQRYAISFFPYCIKQWEILESDAKFSTSVQTFKNEINERIRSAPSVCIDQNRHGMRRLTQIRVDFSDLRDHRYDHRFNCPSPICSCGIEDETTSHFLLCCPRSIVTYVKFILARYLKLQIQMCLYNPTITLRIFFCMEVKRTTVSQMSSF